MRIILGVGSSTLLTVLSIAAANVAAFLNLARITASALAHISLAPVFASVPPVLDGVVAAARNLTSDIGPTRSHLIVKFGNPLALLRRDGTMIQRWLQVLMPAFSTLLCRSAADLSRDEDPILGSSLSPYQMHEASIFKRRPRAFLVFDPGFEEFSHDTEVDKDDNRA